MLRQSKKFLLFTLGLLFSLSFAANAQTLNTLLRQPNDPVAGNPRGKVTVVEFFDYQCSHCMSMAPVIASILKNNSDVRIVFKEFPIRGPMSLFAARAALAANKQGKYYPFSHALLSTNQPLTEALVFEIAKNTGVNVKQMQQDMNSKSITQQLNSNENLAQNLKITGTPAFFIGKTNAKTSADVNFVLGEMTQSELQNAIDSAK